MRERAREREGGEVCVPPPRNVFSPETTHRFALFEHIVVEIFPTCLCLGVARERERERVSACACHPSILHLYNRVHSTPLIPHQTTNQKYMYSYFIFVNSTACPLRFHHLILTLTKGTIQPNSF